MAVFKCKMCGAPLDVNGESILTCDYCGTTQTLPRLDDERKANLYDRANHFRRNNDYDKAMGMYERILNEDTTDAEAYWSLVLCRYGIEYVEDPTSHKRIPTVNRAQFTSIFDDEDYKSALQYADTLQRAVYEAEANTINEIQKNILAISSQEDPFDVFICYKETDQNGRRTPDSVLATELYHELTNEGYKVFFSRITLEDKLGTAYEPYIFSALHSAKAMVVIGTKQEYFNAVWVKNEWSRYLSLIKSGEKKILIPAYRDMDPYDLPEEFSHLQAQDMSKLGFMQDLIRGIKKIVQLESAAPTAAVTSTPMPGVPVAPAGGIVQLMLEGDVMYEGEVFANIPHGFGKATYTNGDLYEGQWQRGKRHGQGKLTTAQYVYEGEWQNNIPQGVGNIQWAAGGVWSGEFRNGNPYTGSGAMYIHTETAALLYEGDLVAGARHGQGKMHYPSKIYEGEWQDDKRHGIGVETDNGDHYEGEWNEDKRHGQGKITWSQGGEWSGEFTWGKPWNGSGTLYFSSKDTNSQPLRYEGACANGKRHGYGTFYYTDSTYEGHWVDGLRQGEGKITWTAGGAWSGIYHQDKPWEGTGIWRYADSIYEGAFVNGEREGEGTFTWNEGGAWSGIFHAGRCWNGSGIWRYSDSIYEGPWVNGKEEGQGKLTWADGGEWNGIFHDGLRWNGGGIWRYSDGCYIGSFVNGEREGEGKFIWNEGGEWTGEFKNGDFWRGSGYMRFAGGSAHFVTTKRGKHKF